MLNYIQVLTLPEITMAIHQCTHFCNNLRLVHKRIVIQITRCLTSTYTYVNLSGRNRRLTTCGVVYNPNMETNIECYVDADFSVGWDQADADNAENIMSHMGYVITYAGCPVLWCSKLQKRN